MPINSCFDPVSTQHRELAGAFAVQRRKAWTAVLDAGFVQPPAPQMKAGEKDFSDNRTASEPKVPT